MMMKVMFCLQAASEVAPATLSMMLRTTPTAKSAAEATQVLRSAWLQVRYLEIFGLVLNALLPNAIIKS